MSLREWEEGVSSAVADARSSLAHLEGTLSAALAGRLYSEDEEAIHLAMSDVRRARESLAHAAKYLPDKTDEV